MKNILFIIGVLFALGLLYYLFMFQRPPRYLYKVVTSQVWEQSKDKDHLELPEFDREFIHLATKEQLPRIIAKFFANQPDILVLKLETKKLPGRLVFEKNPGGTTKYYHLYDGAVIKDAIIEAKKK